MSKMYFDLKAFRKGLLAKKTSLLAAERRAIDRVYAQPAPLGWDIETFLTRAKITEDPNSVVPFFKDWKDFISSNRQDLFRVSNVLNATQIKRLNHHLELFNRSLWPGDLKANFVEPKNPEWTQQDRDQLQCFVKVYGLPNPWIYISYEMNRTVDDVREEFWRISKKYGQKMEISLTKSFRPLLMNRQFRLVPPQVILVKSNIEEMKFLVPPIFEKYLHSYIHNWR